MALENFGKLVSSLALDADVRPARVALEKLLQLECFALSLETGAIGEVDSVLSLQSWWDKGGYTWLESYLTASERLTQKRADARYIILPPTFRRTLALEGHASHRLASLLCPMADADCGRETLGWAARADQDVAMQATEEQKDLENERSTDETADCAKRAKNLPPIRRYQTWRECIEDNRELSSAPPVGRFRAAKSGWFVLRGRRGHHAFCDELRAYDLASGAAYIASSCSHLLLRSDGSIDRAATEAARQTSFSSGHLPLDNLREAVWLALLSSEFERGVQLEAVTVEVPRWIEPVWFGAPAWHSMKGHAWGFSGQTTLAWSWLDQGRTLATGSFVWPRSMGSADDLVARLFAIAEAALEPGCSEARLPKNLLEAATAREQELLEALTVAATCAAKKN